VLCAGQHGVSGSAAAQPATWETAFTAMSLHASIVGLAVNVVFLGVFGASVEDRVGHLAVRGFYLLGGLVALALAVLVAPASVMPTLGASGRSRRCSARTSCSPRERGSGHWWC
jgi:membrane associated rhomboid family serine protease